MLYVSVVVLSQLMKNIDTHFFFIFLLSCSGLATLGIDVSLVSSGGAKTKNKQGGSMENSIVDCASKDILY